MPDGKWLLSHIEGLTPRKLDTWTTSGLLRPTAGSRGIGNPREWPSSEVPVIEAMVRLTGAGVAPKLAEQLARADGQPVDIGGIVLHANVDGGKAA